MLEDTWPAESLEFMLALAGKLAPVEHEVGMLAQGSFGGEFMESLLFGRLHRDSVVFF